MLRSACEHFTTVLINLLVLQARWVVQSCLKLSSASTCQDAGPVLLPLACTLRSSHLSALCCQASCHFPEAHTMGSGPHASPSALEPHAVSLGSTLSPWALCCQAGLCTNSRQPLCVCIGPHATSACWSSMLSGPWDSPGTPEMWLQGSRVCCHCSLSQHFQACADHRGLDGLAVQSGGSSTPALI